MRISGQVFDERTGAPVAGAQVDAVDPSTDGVAGSVFTDAGGSFAVFVPDPPPEDTGGIKPVPAPRPGVLTFRLSRDGAWLGEYTVPVSWASQYDGFVRIVLAQDAVGAGAYRIAGFVFDQSTGQPVAGVTVEVWDRSGRYPSPLGPATTDAGGGFSIAVPRQGDPPDPTFRVYRQGQPLSVGDAGFSFGADGLDAKILVDAGSPAATTYTLVGHTVDRVSRRAVTGLRVELWSPDFSYMLATAVTDASGRFAATLNAPAPGQPPQPRLRLYRDAQLVGQPDVPLAWSPTGSAEVWIDVDAPPEAPRAFRVTGRVVDRTAGTGLAGLRVEAWNKAPRDGGFIGVAADTDSEGAFDISFPRTEETLSVAPPLLVDPLGPRPREPMSPASPLGIGLFPGGGTTPPIVPFPGDGGGWPRPLPLPLPQPAPVFTPPDLFFRIYREQRLVATLDANVQWGAAAVGQTVIEIDPPTDAPASTEVGLHELGQSIAGTVQRVQSELARYPNAMGAYVLDEINLNIPVEMRVDEVGQVMAKVANTETPSDAQVGQVQMRVRPVLGAAPPPPDVAEQPLSELAELAPEAVAKLEAQRIFSVGDLVRAARTAAGRAALETFDLGVDLTRLLDRAAVLSLPMLPVAVREGLLRAGVASPRQFAEADNPDELAEHLSEELGKTVTAEDVKSWQGAVRDALEVPLPTEQLDRAPVDTR